MTRSGVRSTALLLGCLVLAASCASSSPLSTPDRATRGRVLTVRASAFNSVPRQTDGTPNLTAFGVVLRPGMRALAVSRDLEATGLTFGTRVHIEGIPGDWIVLDRMHRRWKRKIDLYMGTDVAAAREWGVRTVEIRWEHPH